MAEETFEIDDDGGLSGDVTVTDTTFVEDGVITTLSDGTVVAGYDTDSDDVIDITLVDESGDGTLDMIIDDADYDGAVDTVYVPGATMSIDESTGEILEINETAPNAEAVYDPSTVPQGSGGGGGTEVVQTVTDSTFEPTVVDTTYVEDGVVTTLSDGTVIADYDTDGDEVIDITLVDESGDGTLDVILDDADYDGAVDTVYVAGATMSVDESTGEIIDVTETNTDEAVYDPSTVPQGSGGVGGTEAVQTVIDTPDEPTVVDTTYVEDGVVTTLSDGTVIADYDTDGDEVIDITLVDESGDGTLDVILDDADYDGAVDTVYVAGATMSVDETTGEIIDVTETNTDEAVYDPSTVPQGAEADEAEYGARTRSDRS